ncbi:hypothetical protein GCM10010377_42570 [Streptomyces viridiviolaceus]|nr:hypothetical protein GCM10010377_42570 [Streptomyces viridiviolaceus]
MPVLGVLGMAFGGDGLLLAVIGQVQVGLPWGVPPGGLNGLLPLVGERGAAVGAHRVAGLPFGLSLLRHASQLLQDAAPAGVCGETATTSTRQQ